MKFKKLTLMLGTIVTLTTVLSPMSAKAYNAGGDGYIRMNSWDVSNFNSSSDLWSEPRSNYDPTKVTDRITSGDYNGDGKDEVVGFYDHGSAQTQIHLLEGSTTTTVFDSGKGNFGAGCITGRIVSGDFNGDGTDEILTLYDYGNATAKLFEFKYDNSQKKFSYNTVSNESGLSCNNIIAMVAGDFDKDNKDEALVFYNYGNNTIGLIEYKRASDGSFKGEVKNKFTQFNGEAIIGKVVAGDFNGDKKDEVVAFYDYGGATTKIFTFSSDNSKYDYKESWSNTGFASSMIKGRVAATNYGNGTKDKVFALYKYENNNTNIFKWELNTQDKFIDSVSKQLTNYEADRVTGRVLAGKFDGQAMRLGAIYDGTTVSSQQEKLINIASHEIGQGPVSTDGTRYGSLTGFPYDAWCASFVSWCANRAGISSSIILPTASCYTSASDFMNKNQWHYRAGYTPKVGDLIYFNWTSVSGTWDHIGIVTSVTNGMVNTIEGNTSNSVARRSYSINDGEIIGYASPTYIK